MISHFTKLFDYNKWANDKVRLNIQNQNINDESILKLFSHIVLSEQIWMLRIEGSDYLNKNFWKALSLSECGNIIKENENKYKKFIVSLTEDKSLKVITYKNSKGIQYTNSIYDTLTHVFFHSSYHRGQIAKEIRRLNKEPVLTDYIAFIREIK